jgi:hypothetical protein
MQARENADAETVERSFACLLGRETFASDPTNVPVFRFPRTEKGVVLGF